MYTKPDIDKRFLELLDRWVEGDFTRSDERELKTLTASDDFLREAMEGFVAAPEADHRRHLQALRDKLLKRPDEGLGLKPLSGGLRAWRPWIAAAASIALLLSAWWYVPRWVTLDEAAGVAQNALPPPPDPFPGRDSSTAVESMTVLSSKPESSGSTSDFSKTSSSLPASPKSVETQAAPAESDIVLSEEKQQDSYASRSLEQETKWTAEIPPAGSGDKPSSTTALPTRPLEESAKLKKSLPVPAAPTAGAPASARKQDTGQWHETDKKPVMDSIKAEAQAELAAPEQSAPEEGWDAFNEYLRLTARLTERARDNNISGTVRVQFSVDEDGNPGGFIFLRSLGHGLEEEAVRLIKARTWLRGTKRPNVTVEVRFVR